MDYKKKLKRRLYLSVSYIIIGIIMIVVPKIFNIESPSSGYGVGYGAGLIACGILLTAKSIKTLKSEENIKKQQIIENDERNIMINNKAKSLTFSVYVIISAIAVIILDLLNMSQLSTAIAFSICLLIIINLICYIVISKKS